jgi:hypothetical protein
MAQADYTPLDLGDVYNAGSESVPGSNPPPLGRRLFHGIPFHLGPATGDAPACVLRLAGGDRPVTIDAGDSTARHVLFLHRQLDSRLLEGGPLGEVVAHYTICYADGSSERLPSA